MATVAEKILSNKVERDVVSGDIVEVPIDLALGQDFSFPPVIDEFEKLNVNSVFDPEKVIIMPDHLTPPHSQRAVDQYNRCKEFAEEHDTVFFHQGTQSQEHVYIPEQGLLKPGDVMLAADSHSCTHGALGAFAAGIGSTDLAFAMAFGRLWVRVPETTRVKYDGTPGDWVSGKDLVLATIKEIGIDGAIYNAIEYGGPTIEALPMDDRFTIANMTVEAGGVTGLVDFDETTAAFIDDRVDEEYEPATPDPDADYAERVSIDCEGMEPQVAKPHRPSNVVPISELTSEEIEIDQAVIGSCTNGRESDLRVAEKVLRGERVADDVRLIITPGSQRLEKRCIERGWTSTFLDADATMENPGCGACFGLRTGALGKDEVAISTTNRNVQGRMGHETSEVYLSNPAVAAASAITGRITHPKEVV